MRPDPAREVGESHYFLRSASDGGSLYVRTHVPVECPQPTGVVIVPPIGRERLRVYQEMRVLGRDLAAAGFPVLRFDYRGEGESEGEFRDATMTTRMQDTVEAAVELRRSTGATGVALIGFHLGAIVAVMAAHQARADLLALCDPVWSVDGYVRNLLRGNVFQQSQYFGRPTAQEGDLRATLRAGKVISFFGFPTAAPFIDELETLTVEETLRTFGGRSAIVTLTSAQSAASQRWVTALGGPQRCVVSSAAMGFSWTTRKRWAPRLGPLTDTLSAWLSQAQLDSGTPASAMAVDRDENRRNDDDGGRGTTTAAR